MAAPMRGLNKNGRGLRELLDAGREELGAEGTNGGIKMLHLSKLIPNKNQPRKTFPESELNELAESIKQYGIVEPLIVVERKDYYMIVAGERRWRAATIAGVKEVPVLVKDYTDEEILEISIIENLQRKGLNPIEEAMGFRQLITEFHNTQDEVALRVSKSRAYVANSMRLLKLSDEVQQMVLDNSISAGHARALLGIEETKDQRGLANRIIKEKLSVRDVEKIVKNYGKQKSPKKKVDTQLINVYQDIERRLKEHLSTKVSVNGKTDGAGEIRIEFYSNEDLERIMEQIVRK